MNTLSDGRVMNSVTEFCQHFETQLAELYATMQNLPYTQFPLIYTVAQVAIQKSKVKRGS